MCCPCNDYLLLHRRESIARTHTIPFLAAAVAVVAVVVAVVVVDTCVDEAH